MDTVKLEYFIRVCECGNLTKAAQSLFISQPALSQAISALERELNCELFRRDKKKLVITQQGQACLKYARQITQAVRTLQQAVSTGEETQLLRVMSTDSYFFSYLVSPFLYDHPNYNFTVDYSDSDVKQVLRTDQIDLCITDHPVEADDLVCHAIFNERTYVLVPPDSPFYGRETAMLKEFDHCPFLRTDISKGEQSTPSFRNMQLINTCLTMNHIHLEFKYMPSNYLSNLWNRTDANMFTSTLGLSADRRTVPDDPKCLVLLEDEYLDFNYHLVYKKGCPPAVQHFVTWLLEHADSLMNLT